jgi:V-type H+-transporting ATPase subunit a
VAENNLNFVNSLKMKISVIIAVVHMTLGVFVKASNSVYYGKWLDFFFEFVPQLAFMIVLFAYMDFLIIYKWNIDWTAATIPNAPSIITTMINMPLRLGKTDDCCGGMPLWGTPGNTSQDHIQFILLMIAAVCVPMMLLPKPLYEIYCKAKHSKPALHSKQSMEYKKLLAGSEVLN